MAVTTLQRLRRECSHSIDLTRRREVKRIVKWLAENHAARIIEVGCGDGYWSTRWMSAAHHCWALDIDSREIARAQNCYGNERLLFIQGDALNLPFPDASFDIGLSICALQNFPNPQKAMAELGRVIRPGGLILLSVDSLLDPSWVSQKYRQYHAKRFRTGQVFGIKSLSKGLAKEGFETMEYRWLLRSPAAGFWSIEQALLHWNINWWFPISLSVSNLADLISSPDSPGLILTVKGKKNK